MPNLVPVTYSGLGGVAVVGITIAAIIIFVLFISFIDIRSLSRRIVRLQRRVFRRKHGHSDAESRIAFNISSRLATAKSQKPLPDAPHPAHWAQETRPSQRRETIISSFSSCYSRSRYGHLLCFDSITGHVRDTIYPIHTPPVPNIPSQYRSSKAYPDLSDQGSNNIYFDDDTAPILLTAQKYKPEMQIRVAEQSMHEDDDFDDISMISAPPLTYRGAIRPGMGVQRVQTKEFQPEELEPYPLLHAPSQKPPAYDSAESYANDYRSLLTRPLRTYSEGIRPGMGVQKRYTMTIMEDWESMRSVVVDPAILEEQQKKDEKEAFEIYKKFWKQKGMGEMKWKGGVGAGRRSHI